MAKKSKEETAPEEERFADEGAAMEEAMQGGSDMETPEDGDQGAEAEQLAAVMEELDAVRTKAEENLEGWQRSQAEFANYRKRIERDRQLQLEDTSAKILVKYLEVIDDIERALKNAPMDGDGAQWAEGIRLIYRKLMTILENEGVTSMMAEGSMFDPKLHEAIAQEESSEHESGQIIEVIQRGYTIGERVLRPAMVRIAK